MWWAATSETLGICDRAIKAASPEAETKPTSWFNPDLNGQPHYGEQAAKHSTPLMPPWMTGYAAPSAAAWPFGAMPTNASPFNAMMAVSPFEAWMNMFPLRGGPIAWPMAFWMLSAGVPKSVAWPAAEANAAMMEAAEVASEQFNTVFANYRTDSGYASLGRATVSHFMAMRSR